MRIRSLGGVNNLFIAVSIDFKSLIFMSWDDSQVKVKKWSCWDEKVNTHLQYGQACLKEN